MVQFSCLRVDLLNRAVFSRQSESIVQYGTKAVYQRGFSSSREPTPPVNQEDVVDGASGWKYPIFASDRVKDRKSVFLAHASTLPIHSDVKKLISHLTSLPDLKKATHCMYAYRIVLDPFHISSNMVGKHDGGESGSGERLLRLLEANKCENVVVVVSRWYGGVKLGSDRWKLISVVAKEALLRGGFIKEGIVDTPKMSGKQVAKNKKK